MWQCGLEGACGLLVEAAPAHLPEFGSWWMQRSKLKRHGPRRFHPFCSELCQVNPTLQDSFILMLFSRYICLVCATLTHFWYVIFKRKALWFKSTEGIEEHMCGYILSVRITTVILAVIYWALTLCRDNAKYFVYINLFNFYNDPVRMIPMLTQFTGVKNEVQRGKMDATLALDIQPVHHQSYAFNYDSTISCFIMVKRSLSSLSIWSVYFCRAVQKIIQSFAHFCMTLWLLWPRLQKSH